MINWMQKLAAQKPGTVQQNPEQKVCHEKYPNTPDTIFEFESDSL
jgi:hypothetical protein